MNSKERRKYIQNLLINNKEPQKGQNLAVDLGVTRQVIVKDIAILRAEGVDIIATPEGYITPRENRKSVKKVFALCHKAEDIEEELKSIVTFGGIIEDVIIEHPLYGEMKGMLMIKTFNDIKNFMKKYKEYKAEPLSSLTGGIHLHTVEAESEEVMEDIIKELKSKNYLISD